MGKKNSKKTTKKSGKKAGKVFGVIGIILLILFFLVSSLIFVSEIWLFNTWAVLTFDEIVYHLSTSLKGSNKDMITAYITHYAIISVLLTVAASVVLLILKKKKAKAYKVMTAVMLVLSVGFLSFVVFDMDKKMGVINYVKQEYLGMEGKDYIAENYVSPSDVKLVFPEKKRNLVYIYAESMELTYADENNGGAFKDNYIPELCDLAREGDCFNGDSDVLNGAYSLPGSTWTMGGLFAQSSGLPLKIPLQGNQMKKQDSFFKDVSAMGDILKGEGYNQTYMIGSEIGFGGRDLYYEQHGNFSIKDYKWAIESGKIPEDYYEFWGYEDEKLFEYAKEELLDLASKGEPFNLTILTVDTHFEDGYICRLCDNKYGNDQYANVISCSSRQINDFVNWMKEQDFYDNTTIVINGDHPTMDKDFCKDVSGKYNRKTYTTIINSAVKATDESMVRQYSTMDLFPTTLAAMGVEIPGGRIALGTNLYDSSVKTLIEKDGVGAATTGLNGSSKFMKELSNVKITDEVMLDLMMKTNVTASKDKKGNTLFTVNKIEKKLNYESLKKAVLRLQEIDPNTGAVIKEYEFKMKIKDNLNDPNKFTVTVDTKIPYTAEALQNLKGNAYIWVEGYDNFKIGSFRFTGISE